MKPLLLMAASALAVGAAACAKAPEPRAALDCPANQGELTRTGVAADGKSCTYVTAEGAEVTLQLLPVSGSAYATLDNLENALLAQRGPAAETGEAKEVSAQPTDAAASARDAEKAAAEAAQDARASAGEAEERTIRKAEADVDIRIGRDGHVVTEDGGRTRVNLPGIDIVADDHTDSAKVRIGPLKIDADGDSATIRMRRDVRLKGEALSREKRGVRATFIAEGPASADGYRFVGYEAGGPKTGPLAVALVRAKSDVHEGGETHRDVVRLVRRNGGV